MTGLVKGLFGSKKPKVDPELEAAQKRQRNQAAEQSQKIAAEKANESFRASRSGRKRLFFGGTGALGVTSKLGTG